MNLREEILREHSKAQCSMIVHWVGENQNRFDELFSLLMSDKEYRVIQRSAWPISYCVEAHPFFIKPHLTLLIAKMKEPGVHEAVKRNGARVLHCIKIPEDLEGEVMNLCFEYLENPKESIACKVYALHIVSGMAKKYPEIVQEIYLLIKDLEKSATPGIKSAIKAAKKRMRK